VTPTSPTLDPPSEPSATAFGPIVTRLRAMARRGLARMFRADRGLFAFRVRRDLGEVVVEGVSRRYTAISLIGLASESAEDCAAVLSGRSREEVCGRLLEEVGTFESLGDVALTLWAAQALGHPGHGRALARLVALEPVAKAWPVVELAWAVSAVCGADGAPRELRAGAAGRLLAAQNPRSGLFPHLVGASPLGLRAHVGSFADQIYPVHALSRYHRVSGDPEALQAARRCAERLCLLQGPAGQWWWHYDHRTGRVIEAYPVYAVHQDAMAPLGLFALEEAGGGPVRDPVRRGLDWLERAPELGGGSLIDGDADLIWRKVARREPRKLSRGLQAAASRLHPGLRVPGLDALLPPGDVDHEDRPYHLGWLLHAWRAPAAASRA
jgi:hypothetical protein